jgi:hypothetical protein
MAENSRRPRPPAAVVVVVILVYVSGVLDVLGGIVTILTRYAPEIEADSRDQLLVTLVGAGGILIGLFTCALASGLFRGRRSARLIVTIALGISFVVAIVDLITDPVNLVVKIGDPVLTALIASALWFGGASRHFARSAS